MANSTGAPSSRPYVLLLTFMLVTAVFLPQQVDASVAFFTHSATWREVARGYYAHAVKAFQVLREKASQTGVLSSKLLHYLATPQTPPSWKDRVAGSVKHCFKSAGTAVKKDTYSLYHKLRASSRSTAKHVWKEFDSLPRCVKSWVMTRAYNLGVSCSSHAKKTDWKALFKTHTEALQSSAEFIVTSMEKASRLVFDAFFAMPVDLAMRFYDESPSYGYYFRLLKSAFVGEQDEAAEFEDDDIKEEIGQLEASMQVVNRHFQALATVIQDMLFQVERPEDRKRKKSKFVYSYFFISLLSWFYMPRIHVFAP